MNPPAQRPGLGTAPPAGAGAPRMLGLVALAVLAGGLCLILALLAGASLWAVALAFPIGGCCALMLGALLLSSGA